ncbi:MAG: stage V sporulation protein AD [Clostridia bacterium]|nr:stage V sporulation protein AD [Clostridia bacterium]
MQNNRSTLFFKNRPMIIGNYSTVGSKEGHGNFSKYFHCVLDDDKFGEKTFEKAERKILEHTLNHAVKSANLSMDDINVLVCGDLLNQIISSTFAARKFGVPYLGLYGACSTMTEGLTLSAILVDGKYVKNVLCGTGTHFSSAERQYRNPLELGNQRPQTSQWTITGAGASVISLDGIGHYIVSATIGKVVDYDVKDVNNMGAAMAPAAMDTLITHFKNTNTKPEDYDLILTGDLGKLGSEILIDLMENKGYNLRENYCDCGHMVYSDTQKTHQGGSGAGCSASVFNSYVLAKLTDGSYNRVLFCATGALLSTLSSQQGDSIPGICHAVEIIRNEKVKKWR